METKTRGTILSALMNFSCLKLCSIFLLKTLLYSHGSLLGDEAVSGVSASHPADAQSSVLSYTCAIVMRMHCKSGMVKLPGFERSPDTHSLQLLS